MHKCLMKTQLEPRALKILCEIQSLEIAPTVHRNLLYDNSGISKYEAYMDFKITVLGQAEKDKIRTIPHTI